MELDGPIINFNGSYTHNPNNPKLKIETTSISKTNFKTIADFMEEKSYLMLLQNTTMMSSHINKIL